MVLGRISAMRRAHLASGGAQPFEGLRRGHFVNQVEVDIKQRRLPGLLMDDVLVPDLFK